MKKFVIEIFNDLTHTVHYTVLKADSIKEARDKALEKAEDECWAISVKEI